MSFTWSYSKLKNFETCAKRHLHYDILKDVSEPRTEQLQEGDDTHMAFHQRLKLGAPLPLGLTQHEAFLAKVSAAPGRLYTEQKLGLTAEFGPCGFFAKNIWFRTVIDCAKVSEKYALIVDWKTGKVMEDMTQLQLMSATIFHHMPTVERVRAALVFVNHDAIKPAEFVREDVTEIWAEILPRVRAMQRAQEQQEFPPKPSGLCKRYCAVVACPHYGRGG